MPIYEYQCIACGHQSEVLQKLSDGPLLDCGQCEQPALRKKISAASFRLKGGGWYETDFKSGNKKNLAGGGDSAPKPDSGSSTADSGGDSSSGKSADGEKKTGKNKSGESSPATSSSADGGKKSA